MLVDHGDEVILPVPYWVSFKDIVRYAGGAPRVRRDRRERRTSSVTAEMVASVRSRRSTKLIVLNSPINPSGAVMSREDMTSSRPPGARARHLRHVRRVLRLSRLHRASLLRRVEVQDAEEHLVIVGSLSKTYAMTGWREGFALDSGTDRVGDAEAAEPVDLESDLDRAESGGGRLERFRRIASKRCARITFVSATDIVGGLREIPGITCTLPQGAFYAYPNVSAYIGRGGIKSGADLASGCSAKRT